MGTCPSSSDESHHKWGDACCPRSTELPIEGGWLACMACGRRTETNNSNTLRCHSSRRPNRSKPASAQSSAGSARALRTAQGATPK